ncbi:Arginase/deacetylase, partial [Sporormia fimetaria CBS 119925]
PTSNGAKIQLPAPVEEKPSMRACDVAKDWFMKELAVHDGLSGGANAGTIVIVHDQCYGHRFSRPRTSKANLNMIVERPERILASVLGISAAYVRLGERHCDGSCPPHPQQDIPQRIPFKIRKTSRLVDITSPAVTNVHGVKWMEELKTMCADAPRKLAATGKELARDPGESAKKELHDGDLYLCSESLNAFQGALGGVLDAVDAVFQGSSTGHGPTRAFVCIRPPGHHCSDDYPSGFCWINNVHVGIEHAMMQYDLTHAAIIDFDLHHGDGSQAIAWSRNKKVQGLPKGTSNKKKTSIGYFSLHDINSFPCENGEDDKIQAASLCVENAHGQTVWNIHLQPWKTEDEFWKIYEERYMILLDKTRHYLKHHTSRLRSSPNHPAPKAAIFLSAGFDASQWEMQGMQRHGTNVPTEFYARFTRDVVRLAEEEGTGVEGRIISVLEGGYSNRALTSGVLSHLSGLTDGQIPVETPAPSGLGFDMSKVLSALSLQDDTAATSSRRDTPTKSYDPLWWHSSQLTELENLTEPPPPVKPKKYKSGPPANYSSPTQSFTAKVVDPTRYQRSVSGNYVPPSPPRGPTPPPPDVDWATATQALSKLLVPSDRQTQSYKHEELAEPKIKKEKPAPELASVHVDPSGRQLRGRKPITSYAEPRSPKRSDSRVNRRRTMAALPTASEDVPRPRSVSRRLSMASSVASVTEERSTTTSSMAPRQSVTPAASIAGDVAVKKARAPTTTTRVPKNAPPLPRVSSGYSKKAAADKGTDNAVDQLTTGIKRITLKLPSKEDHEAREKQKASDAEKKATATAAARTATRRAPASRARPTKASTTTATGANKKAPSRSAKTAKPVTPSDAPSLEVPISDPSLTAVTPAPEEPKIERAVSPPLEQPQPLQPEQAAVLPKSEEVDTPSMVQSVEPPTELADMKITPEQLPKPSFMTTVEHVPHTISPPRPDTPPPPAPCIIPSFTQYSGPAFGSLSAASHPGDPHDGQMQWMANVHDQMSSPPAARQELPMFTSSSVIPFA